jgi:hypothetical protein
MELFKCRTVCRDPVLSSLHVTYMERMGEVATKISKGYTRHLLTSAGNTA